MKQKKNVLFLLLLGLACLTTVSKAETPPPNLGDTQIEVVLQEHIIIQPDIDEELIDDHDVTVPKPEEKSVLAFYMIPKKWVFDLPAFSLTSFQKLVEGRSDYLVGVADFRGSEERWKVSFQLKPTQDTIPLFDKLKSISWETESLAFYALNEDGLPKISLDKAISERMIHTKNIEWNFHEAIELAHSTGPLYGYYALHLKNIRLDVDRYFDDFQKEPVQFDIEWTLSTDIKVIEP